MPVRSPIARFVRVALVLAAGVPFIAGCGEDSSTCPAGSGRILGTITAGEHPVIAALYIQTNTMGHANSLAVQAYTDSSGKYSVALPAADYRIAVRFQDSSLSGYILGRGLTIDPRQAQTFQVVDAQEIHADVFLSAAVLTLSAPAELEGESITATLQPGGRLPGVVGVRDTVRAGQARISFPVGLPGQYQVLVRIGELWNGGAQNESSVWLPATYDRSEAEWVTLEEATETQIQGTIPPPGKITGSITGAWEELNATAPILTLVSETDTSTIATDRSPDGLYSLQVFAPVRARLQIQEILPRWYGGPSYASATVFDLQPPDVVSLDIHQSGIAGRIGRISTYGGTVSVHDVSGTRIDVSQPTGVDGLFHFANLAAGTYYVHVDGDRTWVPQWYDGADSIAAGTPIVIAQEGEVQWITVHLSNGGTISGRISTNGSSAIYASVFAVIPGQEQGGYHAADTVVSSPDGEYRLAVLPNGDYKIGAVLTAGALTLWYPGVADPDSATIVSIRDHGTVTGIDFGSTLRP